jgi:hypothetical protein
MRRNGMARPTKREANEKKRKQERKRDGKYLKLNLPPPPHPLLSVYGDELHNTPLVW